WLASAIVVVGIAGGVVLAAWSLSDEVATFSRQLPNLVREFRGAIQSATPVTIVETTDVQRQMMSYAQSAAGYAGAGILLLFLVYFMLASGDMFKKKFVKLSGERLSQKKVTVQ